MVDCVENSFLGCVCAIDPNYTYYFCLRLRWEKALMVKDIQKFSPPHGESLKSEIHSGDSDGWWFRKWPLGGDCANRGHR